MHKEISKLAGRLVKIKNHVTHPQQHMFGGEMLLIEDWQDRLMGMSWLACDGNPACLIYALRIDMSNENIPVDDEVLYGKLNGLGHLVHITELEIDDESI